MGGFLVTTLILGSLLIAFLLILYKYHSQNDKYNREVRLISYTNYTTDFEFRIQKFYGFLIYLKENEKLGSFLDEEMQEKMKEQGFLNYRVNQMNKEVELIFEKDQYFNYNVIFGYNHKNEFKLVIKSIQETRKNEN
ncbi:hypothetical protein [Oceanirhabdus seepicola]|uniref:Uncharacterized protein n=1 Tax=Oceanirhabdus seepicola TaxID=2828781 RepID=A0A9J6P831_9CLOT|nr:hypothetical protein [Oceanirhabdus seepicola]MCM1992731.1 hypothetical protein [Oceanirhabdus seepicola]